MSKINVFYIVTIYLFLVAVLVCVLFQVSFNFTSSMPAGIYVKDKSQNIKKGDYISLCLDKENTRIGLDNGYLESEYTCKDSVPLIKKVIALPFESVYLTDSFINVSGVRINAATSLYDSNHRILDHIPRGNYKQNCFWVLGDKDVKHSWDSRYWGCISSNQIIYKLKPLLTW